jgi:hypothetical protein
MVGNFALLRMRRGQPSHRSAADRSDEIPPSHVALPEERRHAKSQSKRSYRTTVVGKLERAQGTRVSITFSPSLKSGWGQNLARSISIDQRKFILLVFDLSGFSHKPGSWRDETSSGWKIFWQPEKLLRWRHGAENGSYEDRRYSVVGRVGRMDYQERVCLVEGAPGYQEMVGAIRGRNKRMGQGAPVGEQSRKGG